MVEAKQSQISSPTSPASFVETLVLEHGPLPLLGQFFLHADQAARQRGVTLSLVTLAELAAFFKTRKDWSLYPIFDPAHTHQQPGSGFGFIGRNAEGEVVATQGARFLELGAGSLKAEAESLRIFYGDRERPAQARCSMPAPIAGAITGNVVYSGTTWFRPDHRGRGLASILPRLSRALALTRWNTGFTISFIDWALVERGVAKAYGYRNLDRGVVIENVAEIPHYEAAVGFIPRAELVDDLAWFLANFAIDKEVAVEGGRRDYGT